MGFLDMFKKASLTAEGTVRYLETRKGRLPICWPVGEGVGMIYRLPAEPGQRASLFAKSQSLVVQEGEVAVVLLDGRSQGELSAGHYLFQKKVTTRLDVVWIKTGQQVLKWGVGNATTLDGINLSAHGTLTVKVTGGERFNREIIQGQWEVLPNELQMRLLPNVQGVMRKVLSHFQAIDVKVQREKFQEVIFASLRESLEQLGLGMQGFEVVEINFPPEFDEAIAQKTLVSHQRDARLLEAEGEAKVKQIEAQSSAQAALATGMANAQVLAALKSQGIDPLQLKAIEALQAMAENPVQGNFVTGDYQAKLFGTVANQVFALPEKEDVAALPSLTAKMPEPVADEAPRPDSLTIQEQIDKLADRLVDGEISEETFNRALSVLEKRRAAATESPGSSS